MNGSYQDAGRIFSEALLLTDSAERSGYLDRVCSGNPALRQEVESLLQAHLGGEVVPAAAPSWRYRARRFFRRNWPKLTPLQICLLTWRNMAIASLFWDLMVWGIARQDGMKLPWHTVLVVPPVCLAGPLSLPLVYGLHGLPTLALCVVLYGLGVGWFLWKPSGWSKAVFILLSIFWLMFGIGAVSGLLGWD